MINLQLKIGLWNARGLVKNIEELGLFLSANEIDVMLITETHMRPGLRAYLPGYDQYYANHPSETAKGGSAVFIRSTIAHTQNEPMSRLNIQAASVSVPTNGGCIKISSIYLPPNQPWCKTEFDQLFLSLGNRFIAGGDFNAKHSWWGNIRSCSRGKQLQEAIISSTCEILATGEPTFFSYNTRLTPSALDFFIVNGIALNQLSIEIKYELSSDHLPILATLHHAPQLKAKKQCFLPRGSSVEFFKAELDRRVNLNTKINCPDDIENAISIFMRNIILAASYATPVNQCFSSHRRQATLPPSADALLRLKRRVRKEYARTGDIRIHQIYLRLSNRLQKVLAKVKQRKIDDILESAGPDASFN